MCEHGVVLSNAEKRTLTRLLFWNKTKSFNEKLVLSVGAPSSPLVSNIIMYKFDKALSEKCLSSKITYTRYADDLTFSTNQKGILFEVPSIVRNLLGEIFQHRISLNESKTIFTSKAHNRHVTGVTINNEGQLSIGRERKRMISAMVHKYKNDGLSEVDSSYLAGLISFALHIEPTFIERLKVKYGERVLYNISRGTSNGN
ncbi:reverse transcriptase domain-containing protein [Vibrio sp. 16]|nr:reverse transcriptase domain-containing protein [Vibrio sp. 16]